MSDISFLPAHVLAAMIRRREISAVELLDHFIARCAAHNTKINAIVATDFDRARGMAKEADHALSAGELWGPFHGLPMTIKDALETEGLVTTGGTPDLAAHVPQRDADAVARIKESGAIVFGKTNVPFFSGDLQSYNEVYGTTNNPWDVTRGPGGSSGGAAAALAAGLTPLEIGSDIGGSIRTPAHLCGVFGHKPSFDLVSKRGHVPGLPGALFTGDLSVVGPMARSARDLEIALSMIMGRDDFDALAYQPALPEPRGREARELTIATWFDDPFCPVESENVAIMEQAADALEAAGATVHRDARPGFDFAEAFEVYATLLHGGTTRGFPPATLARMRDVAANLDLTDKSHMAMQARGAALTYHEWQVWKEAQAQMRAKWAAFFDTYDAVLMAVAPVSAFAHDQQSNFHDRTLTINGAQRPYLDLISWAGLPLVSYLPGTAVPVGRTQAGLPVGVQIVGPYLEDFTTIALAAVLEREMGGFVAPPDFA
ncbi:amidase [Pyruvatibacter sp.]|uniref:amidase n=1 Tax=Pyruvatibacter sp. TaxID=1981328 RepID=UPI0032EBF509